ncbi:hypothetical protein BX661DRAFT_206741 [Kickxella alabastrina]|uniref:uncharacterized protein n=1 Tax=Kickxella alabastrina TaxID=61397 RepID=UPI00222029C3|nr:uncharacterized protein BX661DRAFT_206741 [Kickxella alabastrina]KAI7824216.1 hypothetical protein BX661DRAFT_206741 [Kickxella alabastrina]
MTFSSFVRRAARACIPGQKRRAAREAHLIALNMQLEEAQQSAKAFSNMARNMAANFERSMDRAKKCHEMELANTIETLTQESRKGLQEAKAKHTRGLQVAKDRMQMVVDQAAKDKIELQAEIVQIRDNIKNVKDKMAVAVNSAPEVPALASRGSENTLVQSETVMDAADTSSTLLKHTYQESAKRYYQSVDSSSTDAAPANQKCRRNRKIIQFNLYLARAMFLSKHLMFELDDATVDGLRVAELYLLLDDNNGVDTLDRYFFNNLKCFNADKNDDDMEAECLDPDFFRQIPSIASKI